jgi:membrane protein DedA with SNARE-associated domain
VVRPVRRGQRLVRTHGLLRVGQYANDATAISVVNWFVAVLKVVGAAVALLGVSRTPRFLAPRIVGTLLWAAFATLAVYVVGSITQAVVMLTGVAGDAEKVDALT